MTGKKVRSRFACIDTSKPSIQFPTKCKKIRKEEEKKKNQAILGSTNKRKGQVYCYSRYQSENKEV